MQMESISGMQPQFNIRKSINIFSHVNNEKEKLHFIFPIYAEIEFYKVQHTSFFFNKFIYLFIFGCVGSSLLHVGFLQLQQAGATLCCGAWASHCGAFSCCRAQALGTRASVVAVGGLSSCGGWAQQLWLVGSRAQAQQLWRTGLVAPWHMGSSWIRAQNPRPCIGRWILNHCATREVPSIHL